MIFHDKGKILWILTLYTLQKVYGDFSSELDLPYTKIKPRGCRNRLYNSCLGTPIIQCYELDL